MARGFHFKTHKLDLRGFEQWLRAQLEGSAFVAVVAVILSLVRALFTENRALRERLTSRRPKPPSERMSALEAQLAFRFAVPANDAAPAPTTPPPAPEPDASAPEEPKKKRPPRSKEPRYPASLPHVAVFNAVCGSLRDCADCGVAMVPGPMRCVMTLERTVETVYVLCRTDEVLCCPKCDAMVCAPAPPGVLHGGKLGPVLVAEALADRVLDGLPIERQARNFERRGVPIPASTLGRSVLALLREYLVPLAERVHARVERSAHLQLDATGLRVLVPEAPLGSERRTWWVFVGDGRWVSFRVAKEGSTVRLEEVLGCPQAASFQCDATSVTNCISSLYPVVT